MFWCRYYIVADIIYLFIIFLQIQFDIGIEHQQHSTTDWAQFHDVFIYNMYIFLFKFNKKSNKHVHVIHHEEEFLLAVGMFYYFIITQTFFPPNRYNLMLCKENLFCNKKKNNSFCQEIKCEMYFYVRQEMCISVS